tara:strand:- start:19 stop:324 length:306 start_codon:yes stop_codon:yes gene_type:complete
MIDYYGEEDDYIHAKFGDLRKMYNFTDELIEKYPKFCEEYKKYWDGTYSVFKQPQQIVDYVKVNKIPVHFYFNYTDEPATIEEMDGYFERELATPDNLEGK